jgi:nicotinate-nucleotide pyrophosphorylase (carboxylating)
VKPYYITDSFLQNFIQAALQEDVGEGDHSSLASIPEGTTCQARLLVKEEGMIAGIELARAIFSQYDGNLKVEQHLKDGDAIKEGDIAFIVKGPARAVLTTERLVLNCMQRMSGIATLTNRLVKRVEGTRAKLLDTRKTTPNFRLLEKWAVLIGGGQNHRMGLFDMIMLKDNHIDMAGGIEQAIIRTKEYLRAINQELKIEIETRNLEEVNQVLRLGGVDIIMLDNMNVTDMKKAVALIDGKCETEASGGITEEIIRDVALCGVDYISVGALTHSVSSLDMSLKMY